MLRLVYAKRKQAHAGMVRSPHLELAGVGADKFVWRFNSFLEAVPAAVLSKLYRKLAQEPVPSYLTEGKRARSITGLIEVSERGQEGASYPY